MRWIGAGSEKAIRAAAGVARTLRQPHRRLASSGQPAASGGDGSPSGRLLSPPLSGSGRQDRGRTRNSLPTSLGRRSGALARPVGKAALGGRRRFRQQTSLSHGQPFSTAGLVIAIVDRANLPDEVENSGEFSLRQPEL